MGSSHLEERSGSGEWVRGVGQGSGSGVSQGLLIMCDCVRERACSCMKGGPNPWLVLNADSRSKFYMSDGL